MLLTAIHHNLESLISLLSQLQESEYVQPCAALGGATIGEHTRHIIEMFQCLENDYEHGTINYDKRKRDLFVQTHTAAAIGVMQQLQDRIGRPDKPLLLEQAVGSESLSVHTNYFRELLYNLEHCIHHQALIKVGLLQCRPIELHANFGVAGSTIEYRKQCAQ